MEASAGVVAPPVSGAAARLPYRARALWAWAASHAAGARLDLVGAGIWLALVTWQLEGVPGMVMDEGWSLLAARGRWPPANPLSGMTAYAGPLPVLLLRLTGNEHGLWVLRGACVLSNLGVLILIGRMLQRLYPGRRHNVWAVPLVATCPVWLVVPRTGIEVAMFTPLLTVLGLYLATLGTRRAAFGAGAAWGLSLYNHAIGVCFPIAMALAWLISYRRRPAGGLLPLLLGGLLGLAPRLLALALFPDTPLEGSAARYSLLEALGDLRWLPLCLWRTAHGDTVYLRYVGRLAVEPLPYWLLGVAFVLPWRRRWRAVPKPARFVLLSACFAGVLVTSLAPYLAVRFLVLPVLGLAAALAMLGAGAIDRDARYRRTVVGAALAIATFNVYYAIANFHRPWANGELGITKFFLGDRSKRTGNWAYFPKQELVRALLARQPPLEEIVTVPTLQLPLHALLDGRPLRVVPAPEARPDARSVYIDYRWPDSPGEVCVDGREREVCFQDRTVIDGLYVVYARR